LNRARRSRRVLWWVGLIAFATVAAACTNGGTAGTTTTTAPATTSTQVPQTTTTTVATTTTSSATTGRGYGGEVIVADEQEPATLNPFLPGGDTIIGQAYFAGVQEVDGNTLELIPELVTELPTLANGGVVLNDDGTMTVNYQIRDEANWSDGYPITGDDFQFTLDTILDPDLPTDKTTYEDIVGTKVGPKTFSYTLSHPTILYEQLFSSIIPKHVVEGTDFANDWNDKMWPSAGPFVFDSWTKGESIRVVRNDKYWKFDPDTGQQLPYLDAVEFHFYPDTDSIVTAFKGREVDIIQPPSSPDLIADLRTLEPEGAAVEVLSGPLWEHLNFQFGPGRLERNPNSANANLDFRKGVAYAIDYDRIAGEILGNESQRLTSFLEPITPSLSTAAWSQYTYDPDIARQYFDKAKQELGVDTLSVVFTTTSNVDTRVKLSQLLAEMFADVGVDYQNQLEVSQVFFDETLNSGDWDMGEWAWRSSPGLSGAISLFDRFDPGSPSPDSSNYYRWGTTDSSISDDSTARFADIRNEMQQSVDPNVLVPLIQEGEQILADQVVIIPLYANLETAAVWADEVGGFKHNPTSASFTRHNPTSASFTWNIEEWYRADL
jgi:peptide/nickel transport system substrate-binding protein